MKAGGGLLDSINTSINPKWEPAASKRDAFYLKWYPIFDVASPSSSSVGLRWTHGYYRPHRAASAVALGVMMKPPWLYQFPFPLHPSLPFPSPAELIPLPCKSRSLTVCWSPCLCAPSFPPRGWEWIAAVSALCCAPSCPRLWLIVRKGRADTIRRRKRRGFRRYSEALRQPSAVVKDRVCTR